MRQWLKVLGLVLLGSVATQAFTDGPLTPWPNARGRTDENGYVIVSAGTPGATNGPLTPFSNLRVRTDENGYLRVSLANAVLPSAGCVSWNGDTWLQRTAAGKLGISAASCGGSNLGTLTLGTILFGTDNTGDIGASGATRPRTGYFGTSVVVPVVASDGSPATSGFIRMKNGASIYGRNAADSANLQMLDVTSGNRVRIAGGGDDIQWGTVLIALGGGATPTLGTIGGSGPATAAQNSWMRVIDSTGAAFWVPVWK